MRLRNARACAELCRRTQRCKVSRSVSLSSMTAVGRPRADMAPPMLAHIGERSRMEKIPGSAIFRGQSAGRDTRGAPFSEDDEMLAAALAEAELPSLLP